MEEKVLTKEILIDTGNNSDEMEIDLLELLFRLIEKAKYIIAAAMVGAILMASYSLFIAKPTYEATSKLYVLSQQNSAINLSDLQIGSQLTNDYMQVFNTWEVQEMVLQKLGLDYTYKELRQMLKLSNPSDTRILHITATSTDPIEAANIANAFAAVAQHYIAEVMLTDEPSLFSEALIPTEKVGPQRTRNTILGFLVGAVLACAVIVVQFIMDDKIKNADDIRKYALLPTLAVVPVNGGSSKSSAGQVRGKRSKKQKGNDK